MATQSLTEQPATKCLIRTARLLPKLTVVWIQGIVVWTSEEQIAIDDGSGIARVHIQHYDRRDLASCIQHVKVGMYVMVVGEFMSRFRGFRMGMKATTIRDLTPHAPEIECLWNLEVIDAYLYKKAGS